MPINMKEILKAIIPKHINSHDLVGLKCPLRIFEWSGMLSELLIRWLGLIIEDVPAHRLL